MYRRSSLLSPYTMASFSYFFSVVFFLLSSSFCSLHAEGRKTERLHVVGVQSLLPSAVNCSSSEVSTPSTLTVVHRHGPCSRLNHASKPSREQILSQDQARVDSLHRKFATASKYNQSGSSYRQSAAAIPTHIGTSLGSSNYVVTVGFGTPKKDLSLIFDTGSDITWIQCKPCIQCYNQQQPFYDQSQSLTYRNISCASAACSLLDSPTCSSKSACGYVVQYGDNSFSAGFLVKDTLTLTSSAVLPDFVFGCGNQNAGLFGRTAGLLGLGREKVSLISQSSQKFGGVFSYCLPSTAATTGHLTLGRNGTVTNVRFTPMLTDSTMPTFYFLKLTAIIVGGRSLRIKPTVFSNSGTILDSGTVITRLPPSAYSALRSVFQQLMGKFKYLRSPTLSILDTCYNFTGHQMVKVPTISLVFDRGARLDVDFSGVMYVASLSQACLAFAGNGDVGDVAIIGNMQQRKFNVVYDVGSRKIGFGPGGCS